MTEPKCVGCPFRRDCPGCPWTGETDLSEPDLFSLDEESA